MTTSEARSSGPGAEAGAFHYVHDLERFEIEIDLIVGQVQALPAEHIRAEIEQAGLTTTEGERILRFLGDGQDALYTTAQRLKGIVLQ